MSLQKNFDVFIIGELEIWRFDFFFFPLEKLRGDSLGLQLELVAFLGLLLAVVLLAPCLSVPNFFPLFFGVCVISCFGRIYSPEFL